MPSVYSITTEGEEALAAATAETVLQLVASTAVSPKIVEWGLSFDSTSATAQPVVVRLLWQTSTSEGGASAATEVAWDRRTAQGAKAVGRHTFTSESTAPTCFATYNVHPQAGIVVQYPLGREPVLDNSTLSRFGIECTAPAVVNVVGYLAWEE